MEATPLREFPVSRLATDYSEIAWYDLVKAICPDLTDDEWTMMWADQMKWVAEKARQ